MSENVAQLAQETLFQRITGFTHALRRAGLPAHPADTMEFCRGLEYVDLGRPADFYATARTTLVHRREDLEMFDEVFRE